MRYHFFLHYGWFFQNLEKDFIPILLHRTVIKYWIRPLLCFFIFEKKYNEWIKPFSKSKWTGLKYYVNFLSFLAAKCTTSKKARFCENESHSVFDTNTTDWCVYQHILKIVFQFFYISILLIDYLLEPVFCKKQQKEVPDRLLVCRIGDL